MRVPAIVAAALAALVLGAGATGALAADRPTLTDEIAAQLGVSPERLRAAVKAALVARVDGKSVDGLVAAMVAPVKERLAKAVASKRLTQQRADALLERITDRLERLVQRTFAPRAPA
jgi:hypothetical protein